MIGRRLAHYDVLELLGEGGMGVVDRARDVDLGRPAAIKVLLRVQGAPGAPAMSKKGGEMRPFRRPVGLGKPRAL